MRKAIVGRDQELAAAELFLDTVRDRSATLLIEGTAGIGKTTLWQETTERARARGMRVLESRPAPSEARLTYAGLLDVLEGVDGEVFAELPAPQRRALDVALLRADADGPSADQRSIAIGFLGVVRMLSLTGPVLLAVDDVQWLDLPTWRVLEFAMRRLESERIGLVAAARVDGDETQRAPQAQVLPRDRVRHISLGPLPIAALHEILRDELGHSFVRPTLVRIQRASGGNPFFALELARAIIDRGTAEAPPAALAVPGDLAELVSGRLRRLPVSTRRALLVASALSQPTVETLDARAIARAVDAGIVRVDERGRVMFTHPLLASAVYGSAPAERRRAVHRDLADRVAGSEERARHLALATDGPDEAVAAALVAAARAARERGAPDAAIELLELACARTRPGDRDAMFSRRLELAVSIAAGGDPQRARTLLAEIRSDAPPGSERARVIILLSFVTDWSEGSAVATSLCETALAEIGIDDSLRADIHASASRMSDHDPERKAYHARTALELVSRAPADPGLRAYALLAFAEAEFYAGHGVRHEILDEAAALETAASPENVDPVQHLSHTLHLFPHVRPSIRLRGILTLYADDFETARAALELDRQGSFDYGDESQLARVLGRLATLELRTGNLALADRHLQDLAAVVQRTEQRVSMHRGLLVRAQLDALLGRAAAARAGAAQALEIATGKSWAWESCESHAVLGSVEFVLGDLAVARQHFDRAHEAYGRLGLRDPGFIRYHADRIETLIATGELELAAVELAPFEERARTLGRPSALAAAGRCRALLLAGRGDLDGALAAADAACAEHSRVALPFEEGRTLLVKGQIHRRRKEKGLAREALTSALAIFERLGSPPWSARAGAELARLGLPKASRDALSSTEEQIAALAATGLTNRAIAERAFVSPKTVEANLARVYQKLGIHSRAELGRAMAQRERAVTR